MDPLDLRLRQSPRVSVEGRARLRLASSDSLLDAVVLDLSTTGMGLATAVAAAKPTAGERCSFALALDGHGFEGTGIVVWSQRARPDRGDAPNLGVRFERLDAAGEREVAAVVAQGVAAGRRWKPLEPPGVEAASALTPGDTAQPAMTRQEATAPAPPSPTPEPARSTVRASGEGGFDAGSKRPTRSPIRAVWIGAAVLGAIVLAVVAGRAFLGGSESPAPPAGAMAAASGPAEAAALVPVSSEEVAEPGASGMAPPAASELPAVADAPGAPPVPSDAPAPAGARADTASAPAPSDRARRMVAIEPSSADGAEVLVLRADAAFRKEDVFATLIGPDPPRYLLRLSGIEHPWRPPDLAVGSALIQRVRTGLHAGRRGPELHVVLDLATREVEHSWEVDGAELRVHLEPRTP